MPDMKHRNAHFRFSLCGRRCEPEDLTLLDDEVDCPECREKLVMLSYTDTKTDALAVIRSRTFEEEK